MKSSNSLLKHLIQFIVAACCISWAPAAETNVIHINAQQAQKLIADKKVVVLDIRTPEEFAAGHIAGATNINFRAADFEKAIAALDKNQTYVLHCASGNRSTQSLPTFSKLEFKSVCHLDGGIKAWQKEKLPVE
jgi:rhodanese-related sulfurtransferase